MCPTDQHEMVECPVCNNTGLNSAQDGTCSMCNGDGMVTKQEHDEYDTHMSPPKDGMYVVTYMGMDHVEHEEELATLQLAMSYATGVEELGAQCVSITDPDGDEVTY